MILINFEVYMDPVSQKSLYCTHLEGVGNIYGLVCIKNTKFSDFSSEKKAYLLNKYNSSVKHFLNM